MICKSIELIINEDRINEYAKVVNYIEINKLYYLVSGDFFRNYFTLAFDKYSDNIIINLFLKAGANFKSSHNNKSVIIISPSVYSKYTISVVEKLLLMGVSVEAVICRRYGAKRIYNDARSSFHGLFKKVINKILFRNKYYADRLLTKHSNLKSLSLTFGIDFLLVNSLNSSGFVTISKSLRSDLVIFTGGGVIKDSTFKALPEKKFINCHSGFLPYYRGVDCNYWAIYNSDYDKVGVSCHFMTPLVDRGDIILTKNIIIESDVKTIKELDLIVEEAMVASICKSVDFYFNGLLELTPQTFENGGKYFKMHESIMGIVELRLFHEN